MIFDIYAYVGLRNLPSLPFQHKTPHLTLSLKDGETKILQELQVSFRLGLIYDLTFNSPPSPSQP